MEGEHKHSLMAACDRGQRSHGMGPDSLVDSHVSIPMQAVPSPLWVRGLYGGFLGLPKGMLVGKGLNSR